MGNLVSRFVGFSLRVYATLNPMPLLNEAPYGSCNTSSSALDWLQAETNADIGRNCLEYQGLQRCWFSYIPHHVANSGRTDVPLVIHLHGAGGCATLPSVGWGNMAEKDGLW